MRCHICNKPIDRDSEPWRFWAVTGVVCHRCFVRESGQTRWCPHCSAMQTEIDALKAQRDAIINLLDTAFLDGFNAAAIIEERYDCRLDELPGDCDDHEKRYKDEKMAAPYRASLSEIMEGKP